MNSIIEKIYEVVLKKPSAPAFINVGRDLVISYAQFYMLLHSAANELQKRGIKTGDIVGISIGYSPFHCMVVLGLARLGATSVPINPILPAATKSRIASQYNISAVVSESDTGEIAGVKFIKLQSLPELDNPDGFDADGFKPDADTPFRIALSSGTSGPPKGVLFSHGYMLDRITKTLESADDDMRLIPMDLNISIGFVLAIGILSTGGTLVFPKSVAAEDMVFALKQHAVSHTFLSPALASSIVKTLPDQTNAFLALKHLRLGGTASTPELLKLLKARVTPNIYMAYGLSEFGGVSISSLESLVDAPGSCGKIKPWVTAEIVDEREQPLPYGTSGEIRLKMAWMPDGYFMDEENTKLAFRDGWFYTGDRGRINQQQQLFVEGRIDDCFDIGGNKVDPHFIEALLLKHPRVSEAVVFPMPGKNGKNELVAAIIPSEAKGEITLKDYSKQQLGLHAPKRVFLVNDFPRNPSGKILRAELPAMAKAILTKKMAKAESEKSS